MVIIATFPRAFRVCETVQVIVFKSIRCGTTFFIGSGYRRTIGNAQNISHIVVFIDIIHHGTPRRSRRYHSLQSSSVRFVGIGRFRTVTVGEIHSLLKFIIAQLRHIIIICAVLFSSHIVEQTAHVVGISQDFRIGIDDFFDAIPCVVLPFGGISINITFHINSTNIFDRFTKWSVEKFLRTGSILLCYDASCAIIGCTEIAVGVGDIVFRKIRIGNIR